jgi:hypothetical protein
LVQALSISCLFIAPAVAFGEGDASGIDDKVAAIVAAEKPALEALSQDKSVVQGVLHANAAAWTEDGAKALQARWTDPSSPAPVFAAYENNKSVAAFKKTMKAGKGLSKVFSLDKNGCVVATLPRCHDYIHSYETKFLACFKSGEAVVNKPALDLTSKTYSVQISLPIKDGSGAVIGVLVGTYPIR